MIFPGQLFSVIARICFIWLLLRASGIFSYTGICQRGTLSNDCALQARCQSVFGCSPPWQGNVQLMRALVLSVILFYLWTDTIYHEKIDEDAPRAMRVPRILVRAIAQAESIDHPLIVSRSAYDWDSLNSSTDSRDHGYHLVQRSGYAELSTSSPISCF